MNYSSRLSYISSSYVYSKIRLLHLIIIITLIILQLLPSLLIHLFICSPAQQDESADDEQTANDSGRRKGRV